MTDFLVYLVEPSQSALYRIILASTLRRNPRPSIFPAKTPRKVIARSSRGDRVSSTYKDHRELTNVTGAVRSVCLSSQIAPCSSIALNHIFQNIETPELASRESLLCRTLASQGGGPHKMTLLAQPSRSYAGVEHDLNGVGAIGTVPYGSRKLEGGFKTYRPRSSHLFCRACLADLPSNRRWSSQASCRVRSTSQQLSPASSTGFQPLLERPQRSGRSRTKGRTGPHPSGRLQVHLFRYRWGLQQHRWSEPTKSD